MRTVWILWIATGLYANPTGLVVEAGKAALSVQGNTLTVDTSETAILNWDSFSIGKNEITQFISGSKVLNRVVGADLSELLGQLQAKGKIYLINPNGILIGPDALINTNGFFASTLDVSNNQFLSGEALHFQGDSLAKVENFGRIQCASGPVCLLARQVENQGDISADSVSLGGGFEFLVHPEGQAALFIRPDSDAQVINEGTLQGLVIELQSDGHNSLAINNKGIIQASRISQTGGRVFLKAPQGTTEVSGKIVAPQGQVRVLGDAVHITSQAVIDVSHPEGAGAILVGGDYQGKNPDIQNAKITWVGPETSIEADGGDGKVILWSDQATFYYGSISARGGLIKKDGGFVEISGAYLEPVGKVDTTAPYGKIGTLLLDPNDVEIGNTATTNTWSSCGPPISYQFATIPATNQILYTDLQNKLATCSVTIDTSTSSGSGPGGGAITLSRSLTWTANSILTLKAVGDMTIQAGISTQDGNFICTSTGGNLNFFGGPLTFSMNNANMRFTVAGTTVVSTPINLTTTGTGTVDFLCTGAVNMSGNLSCNGVDTTITTAGALNLNSALSTGAGDLDFHTTSTATIQTMAPYLSVTTDTGTIRIASDSSMSIISELDTFSTGGGTVNLESSNNIIITGGINNSAGGNANTSLTASNNIVISEDITTGNGNLTFTAGKDLTIPLPITITSNGSGTISFHADQDVVVYSRINLSGISSGSSLFSAGRDVFLEAPLSATNLDTTVRGLNTTNLSSSPPTTSSFALKHLGLGATAAITGSNSDLQFSAGSDLIISQVTSFDVPTGTLSLAANNDDRAPLSSGVGVLEISPAATISGSSSIGNIGLYAAAPGINTLPPTINGAPLSAGNVVCNIFFPGGNPSYPFSIFYQVCPVSVVIPFELFESALSSILLPDIQRIERRYYLTEKRKRPPKVEMKK